MIGFFKHLFGFGKPPVVDAKVVAEARALIESRARPTVFLERTAQPRFSRLGGLPELPPGVDWPLKGREPMSPVCQIDFAELPDDCKGLGLPDTGVLLFFLIAPPMDNPDSRHFWKIIYRDVPARSCVYTPAPRGIGKHSLYAMMNLRFRLGRTYLDSFEDLDALLEKLPWPEQEVILEPYDTTTGIAHHLLGHPGAIQGYGMEALCREPPDWQPTRTPSDWTLLLQIDSEDDIGMNWGDAGRLYVWIRKDDLAARNFEHTWLTWQCY